MVFDDRKSETFTQRCDEAEDNSEAYKQTNKQTDRIERQIDT